MIRCKNLFVYLNIQWMLYLSFLYNIYQLMALSRNCMQWITLICSWSLLMNGEKFIKVNIFNKKSNLVWQLLQYVQFDLSWWVVEIFVIENHLLLQFWWEPS